MDGFQDLPGQFKRVWTCKIFNKFKILLLVLGGSTLIKRTMKWKGHELNAGAIAKLPTSLFGREQGNITGNKTRSNKMTEV